MAKGFNITGIRTTIKQIDKAYDVKRRKVLRMAQRVEADLTRKAKNNAPIAEGTLAASISGKTIDRGRGRGFRIEVNIGDKVYARRMHESHYQAHSRADRKRVISKSGRSYFKYTSVDLLSTQKSSKRVGGIRGSSTIDKFQRSIHTLRGGFWIDSRGNKHGRKYLERAGKENMPRYRKMFNSLSDR